jgi:flagellar motility protein MotE (MotC chaperone)
MNGFLKYLIIGAAAMFVIAAVATVTALATLKGKGVITPEKVRDFLLSDEERTYIAAMKARPAEPPPVRPEPAVQGIDQERLLADIAEMANARHANALVEELRRRKDTLDERERWIETREAELRAARADLARLSRQLEERRAEMTDAEKRAADERARWAAAQANEVQRVEAMREQEKARYAELAKLYELQKTDAWQTLRKLQPKEVARILDAMDPKKAAQLLKQAQQDPEYPMAVALHRELMQLDPKASSAEQIRRLAQLYSFMKAEQILGYLAGVSPDETAEILMALPTDKQRTELLAAIERSDEKRGREVTARIKPSTPQP